jgi:hypothetical protein
MFTNTLLRTVITLASVAMPALTDSDGISLRVSLWGVGDDMEMFTDHRLINNAPCYTNSVGVMVSSETIPAGEVTFFVTSASEIFEHEMVVASLANATIGLAYDEEIARVSEHAEGRNLGEVAELEPGTT